LIEKVYTSATASKNLTLGARYGSRNSQLSNGTENNSCILQQPIWGQFCCTAARSWLYTVQELHTPKITVRYTRRVKCYDF